MLQSPIFLAPAPEPLPHAHDRYSAAGTKRSAMDSPGAPSPAHRKAARIQTWPEEMEDDYESYGAGGGHHRLEREAECFRRRVWDRPYPQIVQSEFYATRFMPRIMRIVGTTRWTPGFVARLMAFVEAGHHHTDFTQLQFRKCQWKVKTECCEGCGDVVRPSLHALLIVGPISFTWPFCETCEAAFMWIGNCYSALWACAFTNRKWKKQGYAGCATPAFTKSRSPDVHMEAYSGIVDLLDNGIEADLYRPVYLGNKKKNTDE